MVTISEKKVSEKSISRSSYVLVKKVKKYINDDLVNPNLSLKLISYNFDVSPAQFSRLFREVVGEKFIDYVTRLRIERSKYKLIHSHEPIQDIAEQVGYIHVISFNRVFRKITGVSPGQYRRNHAKLKVSD